MTPATRRPLVLVVLDGWGIRESAEHNAIKQARTPVYRELIDRFPHSELVASGEAVGLPAGQMGNSEVGHMNLGAGRIVWQDLTRIDKTIRDGDFFENPPLIAAMDRCRTGNRALHLIGLLSDGGVHSHQRHLHALIEMASARGIKRTFVHAFSDGRDTAPIGGKDYLGHLENEMTHAGVGRLASVVGRYYAMDRDKRWERTRLAYDAIVAGAGTPTTDAISVVEGSYAAGVTDEFIKPIVVVNADKKPIGPIRKDDSVIFFNFRADRARQLTSALAFKAFEGFERTTHPGVHMATMTAYDATYHLPVVFEPQTFTGSLAEVLVARGLTNLRLAETEKYAHVTYFFNCGEERPYPGEDRILVPSQKVATYDLQPQMSAPGITDEMLRDLAGAGHDVVICNFANADMVGHTGNFPAVVQAVETLDTCLGRITTAVRAAGGTLIVTADHGNAESMWDPKRNCPHTAHTTNPVPVILVNDQPAGITLRNGSLRDVAPTMLGLLGIELPKEMDGRDLRDL